MDWLVETWVWVLVGVAYIFSHMVATVDMAAMGKGVMAAGIATPGRHRAAVNHRVPVTGIEVTTALA